MLIKILLISFLINIELSAIANTYYVSTNGNDGNPGSLESPWRTIQHSADVMQPGDSACIRGGIYKEDVTTIRNGNSKGYIVFSGYENENAILQGNSQQSGTGFLITHSYIKLYKLKVHNYESGIAAGNNASFFQITDCEVYECCYGIGFYTVHDFLLIRNLMHHNGAGVVGFNFDVTPSPGQVSYNGVIKDCVSHTQVGEDNVDGFATGHDGVSNILFYNCKVYNCFDGFDLSGRGIVAERCLAHHCFGGGGFKLWRDTITLVNCIGYGCENTNVEIDYDNTVLKGSCAKLINCIFFNSQANIGIDNPQNKLYMYNCIIAGSKGYGLAFYYEGLSNYRGDYNLFHNNDPEQTITNGYNTSSSLGDIENREWAALTGQDSHSKAVFNLSTLFINANIDNPDLHLIAGSVAINNGTSSIPGVPIIDYDNCLRNDGHIDIGAYEFGTCIPGIINRNETNKNFLFPQNFSNTINQQQGFLIVLPNQNIRN